MDRARYSSGGPHSAQRRALRQPPFGSPVLPKSRFLGNETANTQTAHSLTHFSTLDVWLWGRQET
eukprot:4838603-Prymnesium_polylepis.1